MDAELRKLNETAGLTQQITGLEARRAELDEPDDRKPGRSPTTTSPPHRPRPRRRGRRRSRQQKALFQAIVAEIKVVSRAEICPSSLCPWFDHHAGQWGREDSNL